MLRGSRGEVEADYIFRKNVLTKGVPKMDALIEKVFCALGAPETPARKAKTPDLHPDAR